MQLRRELFIYRKTVWKTTWLLRLLVLGAGILVVGLTWRFWLVAIGESLVSEDPAAPADLIVVEDMEANYWLYRIAAELVEDGLAPRVVVATSGRHLNDAIVAVLAEQARLHDYEVVRSDGSEPISLGVARAVETSLADRMPRSMIVVAAGFRSRRAKLIYQHVFGGQGVRIATRPVLGPRRPDNWWQSWHGIQMGLLEFAKLQYYRWLLLL